jgi:predicted MPP superfamily phosphohydrolase
MRRLILLLVVGLFLIECAPARFSRPASGRYAAGPSPNPPGLTFPLERKSVRFAVIGDNGTGRPYEYEVGREMARYHEKFPFDFVIMLGDNIYGGHRPADFVRKFEDPYKPLLEDGVKFYASLGNHDKPAERFYKFFNMNGRNYYTFEKGNVRFFALDSNYMNPQQLDWLAKQLQTSSAQWKICFFHHPLYSDARYHGPDLDLRAQLVPLFERYGVNVVFSGHDHVYERIKPQHGIYYFVMGSAGQLRYHNLHPSSEMASGFDTDRAFMIVEIAGNTLYFQTIARTGKIVDHAALERQKKPSYTAATKRLLPNTWIAAFLPRHLARTPLAFITAPASRREVHS